MDAIEKRARELLAAEYEARGELVHAMNMGRGGLSVMYAAEIAAIAKALTPPEGEQLSESDKDVALAQAVEFADYVERQAKGAMVDAAKRFLSLPYAQELVKRLIPPEDYVAAPQEPSLAMTAAGQLFGLTANQACAVYQSMLAARPEVP